MRATNDLITGFIAVPPFRRRLGLDPGPPECRHVVKRTVLDLIAESVKEERHGSQL
jgi:hypothetical protein